METKRKKTPKDLDKEVRDTGIWLEALEDDVPKMSDWEKGFYESVSDWFYVKGVKLTPRQYETLERLYHKFYG